MEYKIYLLFIYLFVLLFSVTFGLNLPVDSDFISTFDNASHCKKKQTELFENGGTTSLMESEQQLLP